MGGVNGRKINYISYDDAYTPPKTVEMTRKLVEEDKVLLIAAALGTPTNSAVWHYMNQKQGAAAVRVDRRHQMGRSRRAIPGRSAGSPTTRHDTDGLSMEFKQWRFNLRGSNTEPLVRLNVESRADEGLMREKTEELLRLIDG